MAKIKPSYIDVSIVITKEGKHYCSWCPELDIASCGCTYEGAVENLSDAVELYIKTLAGEGELASVLEKRGIKIIHAEESSIPSSFVTRYRQKLPATVG